MVPPSYEGRRGQRQFDKVVQNVAQQRKRRDKTARDCTGAPGAKAFEALRIISSSFEATRLHAGLSNYAAFQNITDRANSILHFALSQLRSLANSFVDEVAGTSESTVIRMPKAHFDAFRTIIPRIVKNDLELVENFARVTRSDNCLAGHDKQEPVSRTFADFANLLTVTRQFIDAIVTDSYQMTRLDPRVTNYFVLDSLRSFEGFATPSMAHAIMRRDLRQLARSPNDVAVACIPHTKFRDRLHFIVLTFFREEQGNFESRVSRLYKFASEFTHVGFVSTYFSTTASDLISGDSFGRAYLLSAENFSEIRFEVLDLGLEILCKVFLSSLLHAIGEMVVTHSVVGYSMELHRLTEQMEAKMSVVTRSYRYFIGQDTARSNEVVSVPCPCGAELRWALPDGLPNLCLSCGSIFSAIVLEHDSGYVMGSVTGIRLVGSKRPVDPRWPVTYFLADENVRVRPTIVPSDEVT
jgi:hypothetical protein